MSRGYISFVLAAFGLVAACQPVAKAAAETVPDYVSEYEKCRREHGGLQKEAQSRGEAAAQIATLKSKYVRIAECVAATADIERLSEARDEAERRLRTLEEQCRKSDSEGSAAACREADNIRSVLADRREKLVAAAAAEGRNCAGISIEDIARYREAVKRVEGAAGHGGKEQDALGGQIEAKDKACTALWIVISQNRILGDWLVPQSDTVIRFVAVGRPGTDIIMEGRIASGDLEELKVGARVFSEVRRDRDAGPPDDDSQVFQGMYYNMGVKPAKWMPAQIVVHVAGDRLEVSSAGDTLELIRFRALLR